MPTRKNSTANISKFWEKICRKLKPVCMAMVTNSTFFRPNLGRKVSDRTSWEKVVGTGSTKRGSSQDHSGRGHGESCYGTSLAVPVLPPSPRPYPGPLCSLGTRVAQKAVPQL